MLNGSLCVLLSAMLGAVVVRARWPSYVALSLMRSHVDGASGGFLAHCQGYLRWWRTWLAWFSPFDFFWRGILAIGSRRFSEEISWLGFYVDLCVVPFFSEIFHSRAAHSFWNDWISLACRVECEICFIRNANKMNSKYLWYKRKPTSFRTLYAQESFSMPWTGSVLIKWHEKRFQFIHSKEGFRHKKGILCIH